ncbi:MAG TPA: S-layer homology domain-containing protein, partial [Paenibacillus sp.]|nr:S-layer homology domain-containing protein [Paenibacillus sp.]
AGTMGGYFTWTAEDTEFMEKEYSSGYTPFSYSLYFLDSKEKKLKGIYSIPRDYYKYGYYNVVLPSGIAVPPGAAYIGVFLELPSATGVEYAKIEFRDETGKDYYAQHATFVDADPKPGVVRGTVTWSASKDEGDLSGYALFAGEESAPFATIPVGKAYSVAVPDYVVDSGFRTVTVLPVDKNGAYLRSTSYRDARVQISDNRLAESLERPGKLSRSAYMYGSGMIKDEDPRPGYLGGSVQTGSSVAEGTAEWYFYDYMGERLAPIGSVAFEIEPNRVPVRFTIPAGTPIPKGAIYVGASVPRPDGTREETGIMIYDDASASSVAFSDIASSDSVGVDRLAALGIVNGYQDGTYRPDVTVTRAQFAAMLVRTFQLPSKPYGGEFTDVVSADWFASATASATDAGLLQGYEDGTFRPNQTITNKEMFAMVNRVFLWRTEEARVDENGLNNLRERFADWNEVPEWLYPALLKLEWYDLLPTDGKLQPDLPVSRKAAAETIYALMTSMYF